VIELETCRGFKFACVEEIVFSLIDSNNRRSRLKPFISVRLAMRLLRLGAQKMAALNPGSDLTRLRALLRRVARQAALGTIVPALRKGEAPVWIPMTPEKSQY
jgi:hypothetical protein